MFSCSSSTSTVLCNGLANESVSASENSTLCVRSHWIGMDRAYQSEIRHDVYPMYLCTCVFVGLVCETDDYSDRMRFGDNKHTVENPVCRACRLDVRNVVVGAMLIGSAAHRMSSGISRWVVVHLHQIAACSVVVQGTRGEQRQWQQGRHN